ncbi:MAG: glycoside hydrolase family 28 protein [Flavobacteriales bacterium]|nr:glycoside hydrolase family 28 protein [Flavobacteriales bacterium]
MDIQTPLKNAVLGLSLMLTVLHISPALAQIYPVTDFGAVADGSTDNTVAIQAAIDTCHAYGGGRVLVSGGDFVTATIRLKSNVELHVAQGAKLLGSAALEGYPVMDSPVPTVMTESRTSLIYAEYADHISITGSGTIDGRGSSFIGENDRPFGLRLISCTNVTIEDIELRNSGFWMMHNLNIDTLTIRNVSIYNHSNSNNDGLSIDGCSNVLIENCTVDSNNDPLVLKATGNVVCENVEARNCTLATWTRAIKIGTETLGGFRNIHLHDLTVQWSSLAFPPFIGVADCGILLSIVDGGYMDHVVVENVTMESVKTALLIRLGDRANALPGEPVPAVGTLQDVTLRNITATVESNITSTISGIPGHYATDITLENVHVTFPGGAAAVAQGSVVQENESAKPENDMFGETLPAHGLYVRHVSGLTLEDVCFTWEAADQRPALVVDDLVDSDDYEGVNSGSGSCIFQPTAMMESDGPGIVHVWADADRKLHFSCDGASLNGIMAHDLSGRLLLKDLDAECGTVSMQMPAGMAVVTVWSASTPNTALVLVR